MQAIIALWQRVFSSTQTLEGIAPLAIRLYLAPVFMQAGWNKLSHFSDTVAWFGNPEWGLGLPLPGLMAGLAAGTELIGGGLLVLGLLTRLVSIPLMVTMLVAIFAVHWENGWLAIADSGSWLANQQVLDSAEKLERGRAILAENGNIDWLTSSGNFVILNNGIEFGATYFVMLLALYFLGGGKYTSLDHFLSRN
ncbi:DoxX family protein [Ferrimonas pelagia]|uniref:DoxX family protein n=1 Tax=Ferrimonas pelagia TaxID=1177826 RepID=A0ABP9EMF6_9GAMM